jgi:hypothetical protein
MTGPTGPMGLQGTAGTNGAQGAAGTPGARGATGATGPAGTNGVNGAPGTNGINGATGATGPPGSNGTNGANGLNGAPGATGTFGPAVGALVTRTTTTAQTLTANQYNAIGFDTSTAPAGGWNNPGTTHTGVNAYLTVPQTGKYVISGGVSLQYYTGSAAGFITLYCALVLNGTVVQAWAQQQYYTITNIYVDFTFNPTMIAALNSGAQLTLQVDPQFSASGATCTVINGASTPYLSMVYIGS